MKMGDESKEQTRRIRRDTDSEEDRANINAFSLQMLR